MSKKYVTFKAFYPFYLSQHSNSNTRRLHYIGSSLVLVLLAFVLITGRFSALLWLPVLGYSFAWVGHFFIERNQPATFTYPSYSLLADFFMLFQALTGKLDHSHFEKDNNQ
jgi:hypothetical protein